jgi:hypothetical protein
MRTQEFHETPEARVLIEGIEESGMVVDIEPLYDRQDRSFVSFMALVLPKVEFGHQLRSVSEEQFRTWKQDPDELALGSNALPLPLEHQSVLLWNHLLGDPRTRGGDTLFLAIDSALQATLRLSRPHHQRPARRRR